MAKDLRTDKLVRIGVFYDGNYFLHVSNYYNYVHQRRSRLSIAGLHEFICKQVAYEEGSDARHSRIVDAHYFRGRLNAQEASQKGNLLYYDRVFDDILMSEGVVTHYLPIRTIFGRRDEKGVEVWLSLEAYELARYKNFDVVVLIASDGDYVPLARKLATIGVRVMLVNWEFEFTNEDGNKTVTRTSQDLAAEVVYNVQMHPLTDGKGLEADFDYNNFFVVPSASRQYDAPDRELREPRQPRAPYVPNPDDGEAVEGEIFSLKNGYGFIKYPPNNLFFHYTTMAGGDFSDLREGDTVAFNLAENEQGEPIAKNVRLVE